MCSKSLTMSVANGIMFYYWMTLVIFEKWAKEKVFIWSLVKLIWFLANSNIFSEAKDPSKFKCLIFFLYQNVIWFIDHGIQVLFSTIYSMKLTAIDWIISFEHMVQFDAMHVIWAGSNSSDKYIMPKFNQLGIFEYMSCIWTINICNAIITHLWLNYGVENISVLFPKTGTYKHNFLYFGDWKSRCSIIFSLSLRLKI